MSEKVLLHYLNIGQTTKEINKYLENQQNLWEFKPKSSKDS